MSNYNMLNYYSNLSSLKTVFSTFDSLIKRFLPKIHTIFEINSVTPDYYSTSWFLTFYILVLPFNTVFRILDIFFSEGYKIIYRVGLAILKLKEKKFIKKPQIDEILMEVKDFSDPIYGNEDFFIKTALGFKFSKKDIIALEKKAMKNQK